MESRINYTVVGIFVVTLTAAFIAGILWLSAGFGAQRYNDYVVYVSESVSGLNISAPVKYRGVDVGFVREVGLRPGSPEEVRLLLAIKEGTPVKEDTIAILSLQGLTGIAYIDLTGGTIDAPLLAAKPAQDHPVIQTGPSLLARMDAAASQMFTNIERVSDSLDAMLEKENQVAFKEALASIRDVAVRLEEVLDQRSVTKASETLDAIHQIASALSRNADSIDGLISNLEAAGQKLPEAVDGLTRMAASLDQAGDELSITMRDTRLEVRHLSQQLAPEALATLADLRELSISMEHFVQELERDPAILLHGRRTVPLGPGE